jgi:hypothetical protein
LTANQSLVCMALMVAVPAFGQQRRSSQSSDDVLIANVEQWNDRPFAMLRKNGFRWPGGDGDRGIAAVRVPKSEAGLAYKLLVQNCKKYRYWLYIRNPKGKMETFFKKGQRSVFCVAQ